MTLTFAGAATTFFATLAVASCGDRTGLSTGHVTEEDADVFEDQFVSLGEDAPPPIDVSLPDVPIINPCPDAAATLIYLIGISNDLYSYLPPNGPAVRIGKIECPGSEGSSPFSMAVDREGIAYVIFQGNEGNASTATGLFRVSTKDATCERTAYDPSQNGNETFGMGFVADVADGGETLFVSQDTGHQVDNNGVLGTIDTTTFLLHSIGAFSPPATGAELTGTGDGRLFAFSPQSEDTGVSSFIAQIDPTNATILGEDPLPGVFQGDGWAFGFWGGNFYTFTSTGQEGPTTVTRFDPHDKSVTVVDTILNDNIVGAGVSTCAPQN
jgi:hypothetical protein